MIDIQLLDETECTSKVHHWTLFDKILTKDLYVWAVCKYCAGIRLFRHSMARISNTAFADTFEDVEEGFVRIKADPSDRFAVEVERRKRAEQTYFKRDKDILQNMRREVCLSY